MIRNCVDCGAILLSQNVTAKRCPVCAQRFANRAKEKYSKPPADPLTADVREADAEGKSYGVWRKDKMLAQQEAREEFYGQVERNRERREHEQQQETT